MATKINIKKEDVDFVKLDKVCHEIPAGRNTYFEPAYHYDFSSLKCYEHIKQNLTWPRYLGTLGGGNHFIELNENDKGEIYIVVHNGLETYSRLAIKYYKEKAASRIGKTVEEASPFELYISGEDKENYLSDMDFFVVLCEYNRKYITDYILKKMGWEMVECIDSCHHYINNKDNIVRHGAISAQKGEKVVIPINSRDGSIIGVGKGNPDWNYSAPHGGGRKMTRAKAMESFSVEDYQNAMKGIYSTYLSKDTMDEIPYAYRDIDTIAKAIKDTVEVTDIIKPIYSYRGSHYKKRQ